MKTFPMFLKMVGRDVVIVGGGEQAAQKARLMLKTEARLILLAPVLDEELQALVDTGRAVHDTGAIGPAHFANAALVFIATGCPGLDAAVHALAKAAGAVVNVVDQPALCDALTPSIVDRDPVVVAIGTEGAAPVLARAIKSDLEARLPATLGPLARLGKAFRKAADVLPMGRRRRDFWADYYFNAGPRAMDQGGEEQVKTTLHAILDQHLNAQERDGHVAFVGAGPGDPDLLTLKARKALDTADVVIHDRLVTPAILELARRKTRSTPLSSNMRPPARRSCASRVAIPPSLAAWTRKSRP